MSEPTPLTPGSDAPAADVGPSPDGASATASATPGAFERASYAKAINRGYGDAMGRGLELALTLLVMVGIGLLADRIFGTAPLFVIVFSVLGFAGITVKLWVGYDLEMRRHESEGAWNKPSGTAS